eukprot:GFYU01034483.1.p1 GENE.GFYU01034483.1~~GFYU01034483.1.p1  ORF type:complete len:109 (+),score=11.91 GFYU01034483.1:52-378(+)
MTNSLPLFALERYFDQYEFTAKHLLCCSDCESFTVKEIFDMYKAGNVKCDVLKDSPEDALLSLSLGYTQTSGMPELKEKVTKLYNTIKPDQVSSASLSRSRSPSQYLI